MAIKKWIPWAGGIAVAAVVIGVGTALVVNQNARDGAQAAAGPIETDAITISDIQGREFTFDERPERIAAYLSSSVELLLALGLADKVVAIDETSKARLSYTDAFDDVVTAGVSSAEIDYEALVAADPDVVFVPEGTAVDEAAAQLEPFDIPVVVLTVWHTAEWEHNLDLLGELFGVQERAADAKALTDRVSELLGRLDGVEPVSIYYESDVDYSTRAGNTPHNAQLVQGGFDSIAADLTTNDIDPEFILSENPEFITRQLGDQNFTPSSPEAADALFEGLLSRPGWSDLAAVKQGNVIVYDTWPLVTAGWNFAPLYYAKWSHPELFEDVEPSALVEEWTTEFLGVDYPGDEEYIHTLDEYLTR
ncbi:ABC transporter substrate-binding protein [Agromyces intestinalis]|uniref:ABC transporter substrate-binding protein n=1 Tax=Agromyces intestinalis TaxID=2592652 RepID=A0A5C1YE45_9MICO|nr:ABC transporter substrate-binding protein [Agromyces intestinalis]QEO14391.1 ABC transporter substrate-binding protein [Agromyces intestinalis]